MTVAIPGIRVQIMRKIQWISCLAFFAMLTNCATLPSDGERNLFLAAPKITKPAIARLVQLDRKTAKMSRLIFINPALVAEARSGSVFWRPFNLNLDRGLSVTVTTTAFETLGSGIERWVADGAGTRFVLVTEKDNNTAQISVDDRSFRIYGTGDSRIHRLIEPNEQLVLEGPDQAEKARPRSRRAQPRFRALCNADHGIFVPPGKGARPTILIVWTPAASNWLSSQGRQINSEIQLIMNTMQGAMMNSRWFAVYPRLVGAQQIHYVEQGPQLDADLSTLTAGNIPGVLQLRNQLRADLVMLIGHYPNANACGKAWVNDDAEFSNTADYGYSVVNVDVQGNTYCDLPISGVHEVGHNFGMRHDRPNGGNSRLPYNFGYVNLQYRLRSIMGYNNQCLARGFSCPVVPHFSAPDQYVSKGGALGAPDAHNMEVLCRTGSSIENNR